MTQESGAKAKLPGMVSDGPVAGTGPRQGTLLRAPSLADALAARLQDDITDGRIKAGEKLPSEHELSETYGVSRPTVREAIGRLKHDGLVLTRQGAGVFVADPRAASVFRLDVADFANKSDVHNIIELLMSVEGAATQLAAERRSPEELAIIRQCLDAVQSAIDRGEPGVDEDFAFHRAIIEASGNPYFRDLLDFLDRKVRTFIRTARQNSARHVGLTEAVQSEHIAIFNAIEAQASHEARAAAERHLLNAAKRLTLYMDDR